MIPVCEPVLDGNEMKYVVDCLETNWISSEGKYVQRFEEMFSAYCGASYGVACSSGTAAIHLAFAALGTGYDDEVIIPTFTLICSANMVILTGAKPVLADADINTWCIDPTKIEEKVTPRTKAIHVVHMYGHPCDMDPIMEIARRHNLYVVEDGAEAHGAEYKGRKIGAIGDIGCFSFYGNKNLTTGEGGMLVTKDKKLAERAKLLRNQAFEEPRFLHRFLGFNYRITNIQAAIGVAQCEKAEEKLERKREIAHTYNELLQDMPDLTLPYEAPWAKNVYWMYALLIQGGFGRSRDEVMRLLKEKGVGTRSFFYPMHQQLLFKGDDPRFPDILGTYPVADDIARKGLYLPSGLGLTRAQITEVVEKLLECRA